LEKLVRVQFNLPLETFQRIRSEAIARGISVQAVARNALAAAFPPGAEPINPTQPTTEQGYRWKSVFLPDGTLISFTHKQSSHVATVVGNELLHDGRVTTPSEFINTISESPRNAWRDIWIKRPGDAGWIPAHQLRTEATEMDDLSIALEAVQPALEGGAASTPPTTALIVPPPGGRHRFGTYPISERMGPRYLNACRGVIAAISNATVGEQSLEAISEAKGMFNRIVRKDRHDWQHVQLILGNPDHATCRQAALWLSEFRQLVKENRPAEAHCAQPVSKIVLRAMSSAETELEREGFRSV
jgi:hypothetical protein